MIRSLIIQIILVVIIFNVASWFRESSMLSAKDNLSERVYRAPVLMTNNQSEKILTIAAQGKTTVLYFFAPWCQVCHLSIGNLQKLYEKKSDIAVIAIALDYSDKAEVLAFTKQHKLSFPVVLGTQELKAAFKIKAYPSYYILDKDNRVIGRSLGYSTELGLYLRTL